MTMTSPSLESLRRDVDALDAQMLDLLLKRFDLAAALSAAKQGDAAPALRPAREAEVLRWLAKNWRGPLPASVGLHMWREMMAAILRAQAPVTLHVADTGREVCGVARAHFGAATPMTVYATPSMVVQALVDDPNAVGVVAVPRTDDVEPGWWSNLGAPEGKGPRIYAKLPFYDEFDVAKHVPAYALASVPPTATGDDTTVVAVSLRGEMSRTKLGQGLKAVGFDARIMAMGRDTPTQSPRRFLVELPGFVQIGDSRINALLAHGGEEIADVAVVGAYANPVIFERGAAA